MTINWFSPVPPAQSAIAQVTAGLLPVLAEKLRIVTWSSEKTWSRSLEKHGEIRHYDPYRPPWRDILAADLSVYHLGNHPTFHFPIWQISRRHPGVVVLHDLKFQDFFDGLLGAGKVSRHEYLALMESYYPGIGPRLAESTWQGTTSIGQLADVCPLTEAVCENALGIAVHTTPGFDSLTGGAKCPVAYVPLCLPHVVDRQDTSHGRAGAVEIQPCKLVAFGFLGANRRIESLLEALATFPQRPRFHLNIYGEASHPARIHARIEELGLGGSVTLHGFVPEAQLDAALRDSDLAINLRYPTMGEASASQLHIWQYALPSLVTKVGWYATLPPGTVAYVRPENEKQDIQHHLAEFLSDPGRYKKMGRDGRRYLDEHHSLQASADAYMSLIDAAIAFRPRWSTYYLSQRAGTAMNPWYKESAARDLLPGPAAQIQLLSSRE